MSFLLRLLYIMARGTFGRHRPMHEPSALTLRVWPNDLDLNVHMNNGRYLTLMDLGRMDLMLRAGAMRLWFGRGWQPLIAVSMCRHFKALKVWQLFTLRTRVLGFDEKWIYFEQRFERAGELYCLAVVKGLMAGKEGPVPTQAVFDLLKVTPPNQALPEYVKKWLGAERELIDELKSKRGS